jgi:hypothetical protein
MEEVGWSNRGVRAKHRRRSHGGGCMWTTDGEREWTSGAEEEERTTLLWISAWGYLIWIGVSWIGDRGRGGDWGTTQQIDPEVHACGCRSLGGWGRRAMRGGGQGAGRGLGGKVGRGQRTAEGADTAGIKRTVSRTIWSLGIGRGERSTGCGDGAGPYRSRDWRRGKGEGGAVVRVVDALLTLLRSSRDLLT